MCTKNQDQIMYGSSDITVTDRLMAGHIEVGALHGFSLKIYEFCSSNALYSESLQSISGRMFDTFDNWDSYYFESNSAWNRLSKFFIKKHVKFFLSLLKKKKELCHTKLYLCSSGIIGAILSNNSYQKRGVQKKEKKEGRSYRGGRGSNLLHNMH